jgi:hypothetical protein
MPPREEFELVETRFISGLGVLEIPTDGDWRAFRLWVDVIRPPDPDFFNGKWNPERSEYAKVTWMADSYVWREDVIRYEKTVLDYFPVEPAAYLAPWLACVFEALDSKLCQILQGGGWGTCVPGDIFYIEPVAYPVIFIRFSCREETALQLRLYGLKFDVPCVGGTPSPKLNQDIPPPIPSLSPDTPLEVSPPYSPPSDDGNSIPYEGDNFPPPPPGACELVSGIISYKFTFNPNTFTAPISGLAPARVVVTNLVGSGTIQRQTSNCQDGVLISEYSQLSFVDQTGGGSVLIYEFVTCSNPNIPVIFNP